MSESIVVAIIVAFQVIITAWLKQGHDKNFRNFLEKNDKDHNTIFANIAKLVNFYNLNVEKDEYVKQMHMNKDFFCNQITSDNLRCYTIYRANEFISIVSHIVDTYEISINNANEIKMAIEHNSSAVKAEMKNRFDSYFVDEYYKNHDILIKRYLKEMQTIIVDLENHHRDRFLKLANEYLIASIEEISLFDDVSGLHEKEQ